MKRRFFFVILLLAVFSLNIVISANEEIPSDGSYKIMVNDEVYAYYGLVSANEEHLFDNAESIDPDVAGVIHSGVKEDEIPSNNGYSNFGIGYDYEIYDGTVDVRFGNTWYTFELRHDPLIEVRYFDIIINKNDLSYSTREWLEEFNKLPYLEQVSINEELMANKMPEDLETAIKAAPALELVEETLISLVHDYSYLDRFIYLAICLFVFILHFLQKLKFYQAETIAIVGVFLQLTYADNLSNFLGKASNFIRYTDSYDKLMFIQNLDWILNYIFVAIIILNVFIYLYHLKS